MPKLPSFIPQYMRAVVLPAPSQSSQALQMRSIPVDMPTGRQVLVKVAACAVAYRDILDRKGAFPFIKQPTVLGHEFAGVVAAAGPDAHEFCVGQRVVSLHWAQREAWPSPLQASQTTIFLSAVHALCVLKQHIQQGNAAVSSMLGLMCNGGYAEYCTVDESAFVSAPSGWTAVDAAPVMSTFGTVWQGAFVRAGATRDRFIFAQLHFGTLQNNLQRMLPCFFVFPMCVLRHSNTCIAATC
jgi:D-arabinose 1-dehydrogenase-like Zn-dependent alcohol dehydrogenase